MNSTQLVVSCGRSLALMAVFAACSNSPAVVLPSDGGSQGDAMVRTGDSGSNDVTRDTAMVHGKDGGARDGARDTTAASGYCPGYPARSPAVQLCSLTSECSERFFECVVEAPHYRCGGAAPRQECAGDGECGAGRVCTHTDCGASLCETACPTQACAAQDKCAGGHCIAKRCNESGAAACADGFSCEVSGFDQDRGCKPVSCAGGFACPAGQDCMVGVVGVDVHGCKQRTCKAAADCACGSCVNGACAPVPGFCANTAPPP